MRQPRKSRSERDCVVVLPVKRQIAVLDEPHARREPSKTAAAPADHAGHQQAAIGLKRGLLVTSVLDRCQPHHGGAMGLKIRGFLEGQASDLHIQTGTREPAHDGGALVDAPPCSQLPLPGAPDAYCSGAGSAGCRGTCPPPGTINMSQCERANRLSMLPSTALSG